MWVGNGCASLYFCSIVLCVHILTSQATQRRVQNKAGKKSNNSTLTFLFNHLENLNNWIMMVFFLLTCLLSLWNLMKIHLWCFQILWKYCMPAIFFSCVCNFLIRMETKALFCLPIPSATNISYWLPISHVHFPLESTYANGDRNFGFILQLNLYDTLLSLLALEKSFLLILKACCLKMY